MTRPAFDPTLCLVIGPDDTLGRDPVWVAERAMEGGVTMVQLRWKHADTDALLALAARLLEVTSRHRVPLLLNDRADLVRRAGAQGAHVGQSDLPASEARALLGPDALLGLSVEHAQQTAAVDARVVDYVGVGPIFATATKPDHTPPLGMGGLEALRPLLPLPVMAIGGLRAEHARAVRAAGADGLAIVSAICAADDPATAASALRTAFARPAAAP